jgi:BirA family transcriptional regulator, biotin operon repressor / biotin---[acetyl-CoA-carboxylase] ligase
MKTLLIDGTETRTTLCEGWTLHEHASVGSTNRECQSLTAWHACRADVQTGGYGRTGRTWVSNEGGLWISVVLPTPGEPARWSTLPLAAGWGLIEALDSLGLPDLRLRWPNDVMVGRRKLAGLLVERFNPHTAVVGIGLNVFNRPPEIDRSLQGHTVNLFELLPLRYSLQDITRLVLRTLRCTHRFIEQEAFPEIARQISERWTRSGLVELTLNDRTGTFRGAFKGVDGTGRLLVTSEDGASHVFAPTDVALLRELHT